MPVTGGAVPLRALADIVRSAPPSHHPVRLDDKPTIALIVFKQPGASTVPVVNEVDRALHELEPQLPGGARFVRIYSQGHILGGVAAELSGSSPLAPYLPSPFCSGCSE